MEVERGLLVAGVDVNSGLEVGNVQRVTERLHVRAQDDVARPEQRLDAVAHLLADLQQDFGQEKNNQSQRGCAK